MRVFISGAEYQVQPKTLLINHQVNQRSFASFNLITELNVVIKKSSVVVINHNEETLFKGTVDVVRDKKNGHKKLHEVYCIDNHYFVDKRVYAKAFMQVLTGDIVKALVDDVLSEEGIYYDAESIQEGIQTSILFNYEYCNNVMDKLADRTGYVWWVDNNKKIYFQDPTTVRNQNTVTDFIIKYGSLELENNRSKFRNLQYIKGAMELSRKKVTNTSFDGVNTNFIMDMPIGELISIRIKYAGESIWRDVADANIGKKNEDTAKTFMWAQGDNVITADRMQLVTGDQLEFTYKGLIPIIGLSTNQRQIEDLKVLEGGSGKVEHIESEPELRGALSAIQSANAKNQKYGRLDQMSLFFTTLQSGYDAGEIVLVDLPSEGLHEDFLIEKLEIYEDNNLIWFDVSLVRGNIFESWARVFQKALEKNNTANQDELKLEEIIVIAKDFSTVWYQADNPNPFNVWYPSDTVFPSDNLFPGFIEETRVTKIKITVNGSEHDVKKTNYINTGNLLTLFYVNPSEMNGTWEEIKFYGGPEGHEILLDTVLVDFVKNELEALQIQRTEVKGW